MIYGRDQIYLGSGDLTRNPTAGKFPHVLYVLNKSEQVGEYHWQAIADQAQKVEEDCRTIEGSLSLLITVVWLLDWNGFDLHENERGRPCALSEQIMVRYIQLKDQNAFAGLPCLLLKKTDSLHADNSRVCIKGVASDRDCWSWAVQKLLRHRMKLLAT